MFYQILTSIIINVIPQNAYVKYIRFFLGMLFIVIALQPVLKILQLADTLDVAYVHRVLEQELEEQDTSFSLDVSKDNYYEESGGFENDYEIEGVSAAKNEEDWGMDKRNEKR